MQQHEPALVIADTTTADGTVTLDWANIRETCLACFLEGGDDAQPGPCTQTPTSAAHLTPGALVQLRRAPRWRNVPRSTAVVIGSVGSGRPGLLALIWIWSLGQPEFGRTVFTVLPEEVTPMYTTLATLPQQSYRILAARHAACQGAEARLLAPLAEPIRKAAH